MNIAIVDQYGRIEIKEVDHIPRIGDRVGLFRVPYPTVTDVIWWPDLDVMKEQGLNFFAYTSSKTLDAIVIVN